MAILEAVRRGWLPEDIEGVSSKFALEDNPPLNFSSIITSMLVFRHSGIAEDFDDSVYQRLILIEEQQ